MATKSTKAILKTVDGMEKALSITKMVTKSTKAIMQKAKHMVKALRIMKMARKGMKAIMKTTNTMVKAFCITEIMHTAHLHFLFFTRFLTQALGTLSITNMVTKSTKAIMKTAK